ncbi:MAG: hypothetical protein QXK88_04240 [Desulfurococcaceae archaeon]
MLMTTEPLWLSMILDRVRPDLEELCSELVVLKECNLVLDSLVESHPLWFEGKKKKTVTAAILYISLLVSRGPRRGVLREALDLAGISKVSLRDALSRLVEVDWSLGVVYFNPKFYSALRKRVALPGYVVPLMLSEVIRAKLSRVSPGLYEFLNVQCKKGVGKDCVSTLLENPATVRDIIISKYGTPIVARRIAERLFASIIEVIGVEKSPAELAELFTSNPEELRKLLASSARSSK